MPLRIAPTIITATYAAAALCPTSEATVVSEGRGTEEPFTAIGYPDESFGQYVFTPRDIPGMATNPKHEGKPCYGLDLTGEPLYAEAANAAAESLGLASDFSGAGSSSQEHNSGAGSLGQESNFRPDGIFTLKYFIAFAKKFGGAKNMVDQKAGLARLWGNDKLIEQIDGGMTEEEIRATWLPDVQQFLKDRKPYLLYK